MNQKIFFGLLLLVCFLSCKKKEETPAPELPATPLPTPAPATGTVSGKVNHFDQFGTLYTTGLHTTTVSIEGKTVTTITDQTGRYSIPGITSGTYTLIFKKPGCGLMKLLNIHYKATDTVTYNANIADMPTFSVTGAYVKDTVWFSGTLDGIYYHAGTNPQHTKATLVAIAGKSPDLDISNPSSYKNYATASLINTYDFNRFMSYSLLQSYQFKKDSTIYIKIYPVSATGASYYDDKLFKPVYTAYGSPYSTIFTITMH